MYRSCARRGGICLLAVLLLMMLPVSGLMAADVPLDAPVYPFLHRIETLGVLEKPLGGHLPYSRCTVLDYLRAIERNSDRLGSVDREELRRHLFVYSDVLDAAEQDYEPAWGGYTPIPIGGRWSLFSNDRDMLAIVDTSEGYAVYINATLFAETQQRPSATLGDDAGEQMVKGNGFSARFRWKDFSLSGTAADYHVSHDPGVLDSTRYPYNLSDGSSSFDFYHSNALAEYETDKLRIGFGKTHARWGPSERTGLAFSGHGLPFSQFRLQGRFEPFDVMVLHGKLIQEPPVVVRVDSLPFSRTAEQYADKYVAAHRIGVQIHDRVSLGLFEMVYYGARPFDPDYLSPLLFLRSAEHYGRDRDNMMMGYDGEWITPWRTRLYFELLLDELVFSQLGNPADFHNKQALLLGLETADPFGLPNVGVTAELLVVRPYVYTHKYAYNRAQHWGINMGPRTPPNSVTTFTEVRFRPAPMLEFALTYEGLSHGQNPVGRNVGGDVRHPYDSRTDSESAPLLDGDLLTRRTLGVSMSWEPALHVSLWAGAANTWSRLEPETGGSTSDTNLLLGGGVSWHPFHLP